MRATRYSLLATRYSLLALISALTLFSGSTLIAATTYYVDADYGTNQEVNPATGQPWGQQPDWAFETIQYAVDRTAPGDTVYVKNAVNTYDESVTISTSNLTLVGYFITPGDLDNGDEVPDSFIEARNGATLMPVVESLFYTGTGIKVTFGTNNVVIRNFQINRFATGVEVIGSDGVVLQNLFCSEQGERFGYNDASRGIAFGSSDYCDVVHCVVYNAGATAIRFRNSSTNNVEDCTVYVSDDNGSDGTDYGICFSADGTISSEFADDNIVENCSVIRQNNTIHGVHAFALIGKENGVARRNKFSNCLSIGTDELFTLRGTGVDGNFFEDSRAIGDATLPLAHARIVLSTGPHHNVFSRITLTDPKDPIMFKMSVNSDSNITKLGYQRTATDNHFDNCVFSRIRDSAIYCSYWNRYADSYSIDRNDFVNCTFDAAPSTAFFFKNRLGIDNVITNCIIQGFDYYEKFIDHDANGDGIYNPTPTTQEFFEFDHGFSFRFCAFSDNTMGTGQPLVDLGSKRFAWPDFPNLHGIDGNRNATPDFVGLVDDFELDPTSSNNVDLIDQGTKYSTRAVPKDYIVVTKTRETSPTLIPFIGEFDRNGGPRKVNGTPDIGAQEVD